MIYRLIDLPSNVVGFNAQWTLSEKDFSEVLIPSVEACVGNKGQLNCLIIVNNSVEHFQISSLKGLKKLMKGKANCQRVAIVSESKSAKLFMNLLSNFFVGEFRVFTSEELEQAIEWAAKGQAIR